MRKIMASLALSLMVAGPVTAGSPNDICYAVTGVQQMKDVYYVDGQAKIDVKGTTYNVWFVLNHTTGEYEPTGSCTYAL